MFNLTLPVTGGGYWLRGYRLSVLTSSLELRPRTDEQFRTQSGPPWVLFWRRRRAPSWAELHFSPPEVCFSIGLASQWRQASNSNMLQFSPGLSGEKSRFLFSPVEPLLNALVSII